MSAALERRSCRLSTVYPMQSGICQRNRCLASGFARLAVVKEGDEVITTSIYVYSYCGSNSPVKGQFPVFVDICPDTFNLDCKQIADKNNCENKGDYSGAFVRPSCRHDAHYGNSPEKQPSK